jgi:3-oxoacyl-(acyl-carrier-protein) synthase
MRRVVVKSIEALTSLGKNLHEYWEGLKNGVSGKTSGHDHLWPE